MYPEICKLGAITIQTYGLLMAIGFSLCYWLATRLAKSTGRNPDEVQTIVLLAAIGGILGARVIYVWQNWATFYANNPLAIFKIWEGGLVFYGGFIAAAIALMCYARFKRESFLSLADFCVIFVPLGHCFGRIGCFFYGCCYGYRCPEDAWYGVAFPKGSAAWVEHVNAHLITPYTSKALPVFPTQLLESVCCGALFLLLWWLYNRKRALVGLCTAVYCTGYAIMRFVIECFRDDFRGATYLGFSFSQLVSFALLGIAIIIFIHLLRRSKHGTVRS